MGLHNIRRLQTIGKRLICQSNIWRDKVGAWFEKNANQKPEYANYILLVPDFFYLLVRLTMDNRIPAIDKAKIAGVIAYFFSPIDFLPEALL